MGLFRFLFLEKKCLVHTTSGNERYFSVGEKLKAQGISFDVVRKSNTSALDSVFGGAEQSARPLVRKSDIDQAQHEFYVKKEDEHLALQALK